MSTVEERTAYLDNPFFEKHVYGDFTTFYITIAICTVFGVFLFALNLICGCCSQHRGYWNDRFTGLTIWWRICESISANRKLICRSGNRWIVALYTATAHKQPPLDLSELQDVKIDFPNKYPVSFLGESLLTQLINCVILGGSRALWVRNEARSKDTKRFWIVDRDATTRIHCSIAQAG